MQVEIVVKTEKEEPNFDELERTKEKAFELAKKSKEWWYMAWDLQEEHLLLYKKTTKIGLRSVIYFLFLFIF